MFAVAIFLNDSNFWCVQSPTTCNKTVHVHVLWPVLYPHNSISNVVVSLTIHDNIHIYVWIQALWQKTWNYCGRSKASSTEHHGKCLTCESFVKLGFCLLSLCLCLCLCVLCFVCCCGARGCGRSGGRGGGGREGGREEKGRDSSNHLGQSFPQDCWNWTALSGKANDWRNRWHVYLNLFSNLKMGKIEKFFGEPLKHVITIRGQILVSRTDDDPLLPCVHLKRHHVYWHHAHTFWNTCARGAGIHGDFFECTHGFFSTSFQCAATHTTPHGDRQRETEEEDREREKRRRKRRDKTKQEKRDWTEVRPPTIYDSQPDLHW